MAQWKEYFWVATRAPDSVHEVAEKNSDWDTAHTDKIQPIIQSIATDSMNVLMMSALGREAHTKSTVGGRMMGKGQQDACSNDFEEVLHIENSKLPNPTLKIEPSCFRQHERFAEQNWSLNLRRGVRAVGRVCRGGHTKRFIKLVEQILPCHLHQCVL